MVIDKETNFLYLADCLPQKQPVFYKIFEKILRENKIQFDLLPRTKDIWAVDYMPIQVNREKFVQFKYEPDYLMNSKTWRNTISNTSEICAAINIPTIQLPVKIDGGNIIAGKVKVIMCDKVIKENPEHGNSTIDMIRNILEVDQVVLLPWDHTDIIGHADGLTRFVDDKTVLINNYSDADKLYGDQIKSALRKAGLEFIEIPYNPYNNQTDLSAEGIYLNYLEMEQHIFLPVFGKKEDELAIKQFENLFVGKTIVPVPSSEIAKEGGVMNCISWNIFV
jgi:agmatine deiminase